jgi:hypothetical protein
MKLKKGSAAAKAYMAKIRAKKGTAKKVNGFTDTLKRKAVSVQKKVAYNVIDKTLKSANTKEKAALTKAKKLIQNTYLGATKKVNTKTTKKIKFNPKNLSVNQDKYKYLNKFYELHEDMEGEPYINVPNGTVYFTGLNIGATKKVGSTLKLHKKETRLGMPPKTKSKSGNGNHKDTKSHNVNIRVISGFSKFVKHKGFTIDVIKLASGKNEYAVYQVSPVTNKVVYYGSYKNLAAAKKWIDRTLYLLKTNFK